MEEVEEQGIIKTFSAPKLNALEKLYVRVYLHTLSHCRAHEAISPGIKKPHSENLYSSRENVQFHINLGLQEKAEALTLSPDLILEKLYKEATREGYGSNHAARIQALTQIGKHLGMFQEKKEEKGFVFNIVSYNSDSQTLIDKIEDKMIEVDVDLPENVLIEDYSQDNE